MMYRSYFATLLLSAVLVGTPYVSHVAYAQDQGNDKQSGYVQEQHHKHFTEAQIKTIHETMRKVHEDNKESLVVLHDLHKKLHDIMHAETFDQSAFLSITKQIADKKNEVSEKRTEAFASIAGQFTPKEREHLFRALEHRHGGWHHHKHHGRHHGHRRGHHHKHRHGHHRHWGRHHHGRHHHQGHKKDFHAWQGQDRGSVHGDNGTSGKIHDGAGLDNNQAIRDNIRNNIQNDSQNDYPPYAHR